jgi:hypothetical protein
MSRLSRGERVRWGLALLLAVSFLLAVGTVIGRSQNNQTYDQGVTALTNCRGIEDLKAQIFDTATSQITRLPTIAYYREHPGELKAALADAQKTANRFAPNDCYALPAVRSAGIERPKRPPKN